MGGGRDTEYDMSPREETETAKVHNLCEVFPTDVELLSGLIISKGVIYSVNCDIRLLCLTLLYELRNNCERPIYIAAVIKLVSGERQIQCVNILHYFPPLHYGLCYNSF